MLTVVAVSDGFGHFESALKEYIKRLGKKVRIELLPSIHRGSGEEIRRKETSLIIEKLAGVKGDKWLLDEQGTHHKTPDLIGLFDRSEGRSGGLTLVIWWAYGVDRGALAPHIHHTWRLSDLIFPHSLALLVVLEQIYRVSEIKKGSGYHHV